MSVYNVYNNSVKINEYLSDVATENQNIQSGKNTIFDTMPTILNNLISLLDTTKGNFITTYLSKDQINDYYNGDITIDEILSTDLVGVYNTYQRLYLFATNMLGNILVTPKQNDISYYASSDSYTLTTDEFESTGAIKISNNSTFEYYTIMQGDTSRGIAMKTLGDPEQYISILQVNNISEAILSQNSLVGTEIKIPISKGLISQASENLVYESDFTQPEKFMHGSDIDVGINNTIPVSSSGDILGISGIDVTYNSIISRLNTSKGSLNAFSSNFGVTNIGDGKSPVLVQINNYLTDFVNQIQEDPRVESVQLNMRSLKWTGEKLEVSATVTFIGSDQTKEVSA